MGQPGSTTLMDPEYYLPTSIGEIKQPFILDHSIPTTVPLDDSHWKRAVVVSTTAPTPTPTSSTTYTSQKEVSVVTTLLVRAASGSLVPIGPIEAYLAGQPNPSRVDEADDDGEIPSVTTFELLPMAVASRAANSESSTQKLSDDLEVFNIPPVSKFPLPQTPYWWPNSAVLRERETIAPVEDDALEDTADDSEVFVEATDLALVRPSVFLAVESTVSQPQLEVWTGPTTFETERRTVTDIQKTPESGVWVMDASVLQPSK